MSVPLESSRKLIGTSRFAPGGFALQNVRHLFILKTDYLWCFCAMFLSIIFFLFSKIGAVQTVKLPEFEFPMIGNNCQI